MDIKEERILADAYVRVSTQEQAKEGYSIGAQSERLQAYCKAKGWELKNLYSDAGYSGAKLERPGLQALLRDIRNHEVNAVLVYKLDRLSRSQKDTLYLIEDVFMRNQVAFVSLNENFDTSTAFGRAMVGILSVFAQLEREQIRERCEMGRTERAREGLWKGGGCPPIGYRYKEAENILEIDDYEAMQVREIFDLYVNRGYTLTNIQKALAASGYRYSSGTWRYARTVKYVLTNPVYTGVIRWKGQEYPGRHTPIVSRELFQRAQERLAKASQQLQSDAPPCRTIQLLTGLLHCGKCGGRYYGAGAYRGSHKLPCSQRSYIHYYSCYSRTKTKPSLVKNPNCKNRNWLAEHLDNLVLSALKALQTAPIRLADTPFYPERDPLKTRLKALDMQAKQLMDLCQYSMASATEIAQRLESLETEKTAIVLRLSDIDSQSYGVNAPSSVVENPLLLVLEKGTQTEKRSLLGALIEDIVLTENTVRIRWAVSLTACVGVKSTQP